MAIESESILNWRAACREYSKAHTDKARVLEADCGEVRCHDNGYEIVCSSRATRLVEIK